MNFPSLLELLGWGLSAFFVTDGHLEHFSYRMVGDVGLFWGAVCMTQTFYIEKCAEWIPLKLVHILRVSADLMDFFGVIRRIGVVLEGLVLMKPFPSIL